MDDSVYKKGKLIEEKYIQYCGFKFPKFVKTEGSSEVDDFDYCDLGKEKD